MGRGRPQGAPELRGTSDLGRENSRQKAPKREPAGELREEGRRARLVRSKDGKWGAGGVKAGGHKPQGATCRGKPLQWVLYLGERHEVR